jgi:hypothetical protein
VKLAALGIWKRFNESLAEPMARNAPDSTANEAAHESGTARIVNLPRSIRRTCARSSTKEGIEIGRENERLAVPCRYIQGQEIVSTKRKTCFRRAISRLSLNIIFTRENRGCPGARAIQ